MIRILIASTIWLIMVSIMLASISYLGKLDKDPDEVASSRHLNDDSQKEL